MVHSFTAEYFNHGLHGFPEILELLSEAGSSHRFVLRIFWQQKGTKKARVDADYTD
jgi:hypothetical protein